MSELKSRFENPTVTPAQDANFSFRRLPGIPSGEAQGMLPGMAVIGVYLLIVAMLNAFSAMRNTFGGGAAKYSILGICTLVVVGVFGMLRLRRWGWSLVTTGCLLMAAGFFYGFHRTHIPPYIVQGLFLLCFFSTWFVRKRAHACGESDSAQIVRQPILRRRIFPDMNASSEQHATGTLSK